MEKIYELEVGAWHIFLDFGQVEKVVGVQNYRDTIKDIKKQNISFTSYKEKRAGDIARFTGVYMGFSKKFISLMKENGVNNFKEYPIKIAFPENCQLYYYLEIKCKPIKRLKKKKKGLMGLDSIFFDLKEWGGEDLFVIQDTLVILCTEKVKKLVEKNKLKAFKFEEVKPV